VLLTMVPFTMAAGAATPPPAQDTSTFCQNVPPDNPFTDVGPGAHHDNILCLAAAGITRGTTDNTTYSPNNPVLRDQMASFIARTLDEVNRLETPGTSLQDLPTDDDDDDFFDDVPDSNVHKNDIGRLFEAGIVNGSDARNFNPSGPVTRAQMASFINRSEEYLTGTPFTSSDDFFTDDNGNVHEANINGIASVGIATGDGAGSYAPNAPVTRQQMASFIVRWIAVEEAAGDIEPLPAATGPDLVSSTLGDNDVSHDLTQGDSIALTFAEPVDVTSSITIVDGHGSVVVFTDDAPTPSDETPATFALSNGNKTVTITTTSPTVFKSGGGLVASRITIIDAQGITHVDTAAPWNPDAEPIAEVQLSFTAAPAP
jgi:hypothetical protein